MAKRRSYPRRRVGQPYRGRRPLSRRRGAVATVLPAPEPAMSAQVLIPPTLSVQEMASLMNISPIAAIKELMKMGIMVTINQVIDREMAIHVATALGVEVLSQAPEAEEITLEADQLPLEEEEPTSLQPRPPVVTVLGHVDHGKTSLLDAIRQTEVAASEVGGITQHIGAYQVEIHGQRITFLDTPGHEAFTALRARGAQVTDIAVLVVAADDGVMPQTVEAINHARAAGVPIIVAINKVDKPEANPNRVKQQLGEQGLVLEEWGGDVICVEVSAKQRLGLEQLLENILVVTEVAELRANPHCPAEGTIIEASLDRMRGPLATVLVQWGTLHSGGRVVARGTWGRVKAMFDEHGRAVKAAPPSTPVIVLGFEDVPHAGDHLQVVVDDRTARLLVQKYREEQERRTAAAAPVLSLEQVSAGVQTGSVKELNVVLKADVQGSIEAIRDALGRLETYGVRIRILHAAAGSINGSDVLLATASKGIIIGFNTKPDQVVRRLAETEGVQIRLYQVIYTLIEEIEKALKGLLEPVVREVMEGHAEIRQLFRLRREGIVTGAYVLDGKLTRHGLVRLVRDDQVILDSRIASLKRFKEDVREVTSGYECGVGIAGASDIQVGDRLECYRRETAPA